jgi:hypothetical protein
MTQCAGIKADGEPCGGIAKAGSDWCPAHDPARRQARRRAASKTARNKRGGELQVLKKRVRELYREIHAGEVDCKSGAVLTSSPTPKLASWILNTATGTTNDYC